MNIKTKTHSPIRRILVLLFLLAAPGICPLQAGTPLQPGDPAGRSSLPGSGETDISVRQATQTIRGKVTDAKGLPLPGVTIVVKGTTIGTITDADGNYNLNNIPADAVLVFSFVGMRTQEIPYTGQPSLNVTMTEETIGIEEVVAVGYGTQAKKDITGSVAVVSPEALAETPVATFAEALQGKASGVYVSTTGAPGSETTIRIRGVGSLNGSDPLIVVDGVSNVSVNSVNPNDIESLQVLKDASATAIYGAQGANGVIIITTRQGTKSGRVRISYDGYSGWAKMANDGFDVLNAWEAMEFQAQGLVNLRDVRHVTTGLSHTQFGSLDANNQLTMPYAIKPAGLSKEQVIAQFGSIEAWEASYKDDGTNSWSRSAYYQMLEDGYPEEEARKGTDWYDLIEQTGFVQNHQISVLGGSEKGTYSMSVGYTRREGTVKSSYFDRYSLRTNATFIPNKYFTIGQNTNVAGMKFGGDRGIQGDSYIFAQTYTVQPWVPVYNVGGDYVGSQASEGGRNNSAVMTAENAKNDWTKMFRGQTAVFAELRPIEGLSIKTQYSVRLNGSWERTFNERDIMSNKEGSSTNSLNETADWRLNWQWTNTATYTKKFNEDHRMTVVLGSEAMKNDLGRNISASRIYYTFEDVPNTWIIDNGSSSNLSNSGYMHSKTTMFGLFGRADYSYKGKYLATATVRRDGSSKFSDDNRWGTFPSVSVGWRISDEPFMEPT
ncbi:MAG: SusC/RagA family TonB-linked outer membrane protein, partial [Porphyromonadaceae bacterium]|nr:SusC/RagA family TonB-linked outer membrane protein [Porphyromonadaceae bacterium]